MYRIAGNFRGRKLLQFCGYLRKFSPRKLNFLPIRRSFLPPKFLLWEWEYVSSVYHDNQLASLFVHIRESLLCKNHHLFAKVFSLESFPLYGNTMYVHCILLSNMIISLSLCSFWPEDIGWCVIVDLCTYVGAVVLTMVQKLRCVYHI